MILMTSEVIRKMNRMSQECIKGGGEVFGSQPNVRGLSLFPSLGFLLQAHIEQKVREE